MSTNRIRHFEPAPRKTASKQVSQPAMAAIGSSAVGYAAVALPWPQQQTFQQIYQLAYERAKKATETPRYMRRLFSVWN